MNRWIGFLSKPAIELRLPRDFNRETMYPFIASAIDCERMEPRCSRLKFDFEQLKFIEPVGVVVLSNTIEWLEERGVAISMVSHNNLTAAIQFLDDFGFFERYIKKRLNPNSTTRSTTRPLQLVSHARSFAYIEELIHWLSPRLHLSTAALTGLKVCLWEIFNNIRDHADSDTGCIFVQHYPRREEIAIAISDFGIGIPRNVCQVAPDLSDHEAILMATGAGFTTKPGGRNRGAGLDILLNTVVGTNKGTVSIHSMRGILTSVRSGEGIERRARPSRQGAYPGTLVSLTLRTDTFDMSIAEEEAFEW